MDVFSGSTQPVVHIEVILQNITDTFVRTDQQIQSEVSTWLSESFTSLRLNDHLTGYNDLESSDLIDAIIVVDYSGPALERDRYDVAGVTLDVQAYTLHDEHALPKRRSIQQLQGADEDAPSMRVTTLPNTQLQGQWEALLFDDPIPARLLRFVTRMIVLTKCPDLSPTMFHFSRLILLYGPPGTGKTTLCRALAQKVVIRVGQHFPSGKLIELNANALLSKWFSESGKLVSKAFDEIHDLAKSGASLICVLLDEVETLAGSRENLMAGSDCRDGLRATNQLLTAIDRLRLLPNVLILCTSNLSSAIDSAFMDRVDLKQYVPPPLEKATYDILRSCINELIRTGHISPANGRNDSTPSLESSATPYDGGQDQIIDNDGPENRDDLANTIKIRPFHEMKHLHFADPDSPSRRLWTIAQKCSGLSARMLRRLPFIAVAMYTYGDHCTFDEALVALDIATQQELAATGTVVQ